MDNKKSIDTFNHLWYYLGSQLNHLHIHNFNIQYKIKCMFKTKYLGSYHTFFVALDALIFI